VGISDGQEMQPPQVPEIRKPDFYMCEETMKTILDRKPFNYHVVVEPVLYGNESAGDIAGRCETIAEFARHMALVDRAYVDWDIPSAAMCSHCGSDWEEAPLCCDAALDEYIEEHPNLPQHTEEYLAFMVEIGESVVKAAQQELRRNQIALAVARQR